MSGDRALMRRQPLPEVVLIDVDFADLIKIRSALTLVAGEADLMPMFNPGHGRIVEREGFAVVGYGGDRENIPMVTAAGVLRHCPHGLAAGLRNMSFFSDLPVAGEYSFIEANPLLDHVSGRIAVLGALWRSTNMPGAGVTKRLWPSLLETALDRFDPDWIVGLIRGGKSGWLGYEVEGFRHFWEGTTYRHPNWNGGHQVDDFTVCAMSRAEAQAIVDATYPNPFPAAATCATAQRISELSVGNDRSAKAGAPGDPPTALLTG